MRDVSPYVRAVGCAMLMGFGVYCATNSVDFPVYHRVATQVARGDYEIYPTAVFTAGVVPAHGFRYAPAIAFLFVPFGLLPLEVAAFLFFILKVGAVVYVGSVVARYAGSATPTRTLMLASLLVAAGYVVEEFHYGNFHFFCIALMVFAFDSAESGRVVRPAVALGIAIATKVTPVLLLAYFAWRRRFGLCAATLVVLAIIAILPAGVVGYRMNNHLLEGFAKYALQKIDEGDNYALRGLLLNMGLSSGAVTWVWLLTVLVGSVVVVAALWPNPVAPASRLLEFCVVVTAMLLASPHTQRRYFIALYVPIAALLALRGTGWTLPEAPLVRVALALTAAMGTVLPLVFAGHRLALLYQAYSPHFLGALVMLVALVLVAMRMKSTEQDQSALPVALTSAAAPRDCQPRSARLRRADSSSQSAL
jgi:MFS family permease